MKLSLRSLYFLPLILLIALALGLMWPAAAHHFSHYRHLFLLVIMFFVGLDQEVQALVREAKKFPSVLVSLALNYLFFSLLAWGFGWLFFRGEPAIVGFAVLGAVPVTLTSAVIFTRMDQGNDRLALIVVFTSQVMGIVMTPLLLRFFVLLVGGGAGYPDKLSIDVGPMMGQLLVYFLLPLFGGMMVRRLFAIEQWVRYLARPEQVVIALFVFVGAGQIPPASPWGTIGKSLIAVLLLQMVLSVTVRELVTRVFLKEDRTPLFYTATQKTLPAGLYLIISYFPGAAIFPMVFYHLAQLTIGRLYWLPPQGSQRGIG